MPKRILIVDDEPRYLRLLEANLRTEGYEVATAQDGVQALDVFSGQPIDLVLLDVMMPRQDGLETLRRVRALDRDLAVVMITGRSGCSLFSRAASSRPSNRGIRISVTTMSGLCDAIFPSASTPSAAVCTVRQYISRKVDTAPRSPVSSSTYSRVIGSRSVIGSLL